MVLEMVIVMEKKMAVLMAVMVVAVVGGHFDPKIKISNSWLSSPPGPHRSHTQDLETRPQPKFWIFDKLIEAL